MLADLERLIALQGYNSTAREAQRLLAEEPERASAFEARLDAARQGVASGRAELAANQDLHRAIEKDVAVHQGRLSKFRDQLMAVKTNVEYQAVQKEIAFAQSEVKALEDRILERMMEADDLTATLKRAENALAAEQKAVEAERRVLSEQLAEQQQALERVAGLRTTLAAAIDPKILALFDLVSNRRNGIAVAEARDGICTICHVRLRPQVFNTVRRNEAIVQCDSCNRILHFTPLPAPAAEPAGQPEALP